jgi:hypothetical protein
MSHGRTTQRTLHPTSKQVSKREETEGERRRRKGKGREYSYLRMRKVRGIFGDILLVLVAAREQTTGERGPGVESDLLFLEEGEELFFSLSNEDAIVTLK